LGEDVLVFEEAKLIRRFPGEIPVERWIAVEVLLANQLRVEENRVVPDPFIKV
jgi:hypothetical protein